MEVKIDTKEKFQILTPTSPVLSANVTAIITQIATEILRGEIKNVVLNLSQTDTIEDNAAAENLAQLQQTFYTSDASFVICELKPAVAQKLEQLDLLDGMNITPTESEAMDMVQMEEIERELLGGE